MSTANLRNSNIKQKEVDELIMRYQLNPNIQDIYVEGEWDRRVIGWFLRRSGVTRIAIYDVGGVNIDVSCLAGHGLPDGKKGRVVALALELGAKAVLPTQVTCIADSDYDHLLSNQYSSPLLLTTDYSSQESYFLNEEVLGKFLDIVVGSCPISSRELLDSFLPILQYLHLIRATNLSLGWGMEWMPLDKCCRIVNHRILFDFAEFKLRYLHKNRKYHQMSDFDSRMNELKRLLKPDPLHHITKSDAFALLAEYLPSFCKDASLHNAEYIGRSLAGCAEYDVIRAFPMYQSLLMRLQKT